MGALEGQQYLLTKDNFERLIVELPLDEMTKDNEFIMTNITPPELQTIYSEEQLKNSNRNNRVRIDVGRAVGKISFAYVASEVETGELHGSLENISYKILNNPAKMHLMPVIENNILITPHHSYTSYPANYFTPTAKDTDILNTPWLTATTKQTLEDYPKEEFNYGYCIENNNKVSRKSNSTMLLVQAKFIPAVWLNPDGTRGDAPAADKNGTFYRIGQFNANEVLYAYTQGYYNAYPDEVLDILNTPIPATGLYKAVEYKDGITYYGFWLKNNNQYQVKRNTYYKVAITHIHGAGEPGPGDTIDPDVDPDDEATYGRLLVLPENWIEENQLITIGEEPSDDDDLIGGGGSVNPKPWEDEEDQEEELGSNNNNFN